MDNFTPKGDSTLLIALVGNPNSGKTSLFNALTGLRHKVANYPGVTVERREGKVVFADGVAVRLIDLPGVYSLLGMSIDEGVTVSYLTGSPHSVASSGVGEKPYLLLAVVDSCALERGLFLVSALMDLGIPMVVVLTMNELAASRGITIRPALLSRALGIPVFDLSLRNKDHINMFVRELATLTTNLPKLLPVPVGGSAASANNSAVAEVEARYKWAHQITQQVQVFAATEAYRRSLKIDKWCTHPVVGIALFLLIMAGLFQSVFTFATWPMGWIESVIAYIARGAEAVLPGGVIESLVVDGIIGGVGSVVVFVPQIAILFFLLSFLEETGYLTRAAYVMDRVMRPFGLQGRSFIPLLSSFACAIPGILSTRTIGSFSDRMTTILVAPLMSCSARLPVYSVLIGASIPDNYLFGFLSVRGLVLLGLYLLGIVAAAVVALVLRITLFRGAPSLYLMEMPPFRLPTLRVPYLQALERVKVFLRDAGTVILSCSVILWILAYFPSQGDVPTSFAGMLGKLIEPVLAPLGFGWEIAIAIIGSFAAREVFVSTLATVYRLGAEGDDAAVESLTTVLGSRMLDGSFSLATALSLLVFYVFACQCFSTLAVVRRETGSWKWPTVMFIYMTFLAYVAAFATYRLALWSGA